MMKEKDIIILVIGGISFFIFLAVLAFLIRRLLIDSFHKKCRHLGLKPSPLDRWYCVGKWQDAHVVVEKCSANYGKTCSTIYVFMDLGDLPAEATRNIEYFMQGLQTNYFTVKRIEENRGLGKIVSGSWRGLYFYSDHLRLNATTLHIKQLCNALYQIRTELRRRIFQNFRISERKKNF